VALLLLGAQSAAANLLVNGSFELGSDPGSGVIRCNPGQSCITGWTVTRGQIDYVGSYWQAADGTRTVSLNGLIATAGGISQTFETQPGHVYVVTFALAADPQGDPTVQMLRVEAAGQSEDYSFDHTGYSRTSMGYVDCVWQFTAVATSTTLEFYSLIDAGYGPVLDFVNVDELPASPPTGTETLRDDFDGSSVGSAWVVSQNGGQITVDGSVVTLSSSGTTFPFIRNASTIIPPGDFSLICRMRYNTAGTWGSGLCWAIGLPQNGTTNPCTGIAAPNLGLWNDTSSHAMRLFNGLQAACPTHPLTLAASNDADWHTYEFSRTGSLMVLRRDDSVVWVREDPYGGVFGLDVWFGAPHLVSPAGPWTSLSLDYISVRKTGDLPTGYNFPDFSSTSGLTLYGSTAVVGSALRLTPASTSQNGGASWSLPIGTNEFHADFLFQVTGSGGTGAGADGFTFCVRGPGSNVPGAGGGGLGYGGVTPSIAVGVDMYNNGGSDPNANHLEIDVNGSMTSVATAPDPLGAGVLFKSGSVYHLWVDYDGSLLQVAIAAAGAPKPAPVLSVALVSSFSWGLAGFTAATGAGYANQDILSWSYSTAPPAVLSAPVGLTVANTGTSTSLKLKWNDNPPSESVDHYRIYRSEGGGPPSAIATVTAPALEDVTLTRATEYTYFVSALHNTTEGPLSESQTGTPDYYPVLLVHGLWGDHRTFTDCPDSFPCDIADPTKLGDRLHSLELRRLYYAEYLKSGGIPDAAATVRMRLHEVLDACPGEKVILVAHSQGGLISRYLLQHGEAEHIAEVIMLGTPNHGSDLALAKYLIDVVGAGVVRPYERKLVNAALGELGINQVKDLIPGSSFLTQLNYGANGTPDESSFLCASRPPELLPAGVPLWLIHGTSQWCVPAFWARLIRPSNLLCVPNDGVVESGQGTDGDLVALPSEFKRTDDGLDTHTPRQLAAHLPVAAGGDSPCFATLLTHDAICSFVYQVITGVAMGTEAALPAAHVVHAADEEPELHSIGRCTGVAGAEPVEDTLHVDSAREVWFVQSGVTSGLTFSLRSPMGQSVSPEDTSANVSFVVDSSLAVQAYVITAPASGSWVLRTSGPAQEYLVEALAETDTVLSVEVQSGAGTVLVAAALEADGIPMLDAVVSGTMQGPVGAVSVSFYDDGNHADGAPADGLWGASVPALADGGYACSIQGRLYAGDGSIILERGAVGAAVMEAVCDLRLAADGVVVTRAGVSRESLLVAVEVENTTDVPATNVYIAMSAGGQPPLCQGPLIVPAHAVQPVTFLWLPIDTTEVLLRLYVDEQTLLTQARHDNDTAFVHVTPTTVAVPPHSQLRLALGPMTPNPAHHGCTVQFALPEAGHVSLQVYDIAGRKIMTLRDEWLPAGVHRAWWDGTIDGRERSRAGVYYCQLRLGGVRLTRSLIVLR
jgi:choice-of-anchor C domain-containing protein